MDRVKKRDKSITQLLEIEMLPAMSNPKNTHLLVYTQNKSQKSNRKKKEAAAYTLPKDRCLPKTAINLN